jgi:hypothetical protein
VVQIQLNRRGTPTDSEAQTSSQLRFVALRVRVAGKLVSSGAAGAIVAGRYAMFYIPVRGGYFFSTEPVDRSAFVHIGVVDRTKLSFTLENENYDCESEAPILLGSDRGEIWGYHNPSYKPAGNWTQNDAREASRDQFFTAASNSVNWWLP